MVAHRKTRNPNQYCDDNDVQEEHQDEYRSKYNSYGFLHDHPSSLHVRRHHRDHVQTSSNKGGVVLAESSNDYLFVSNGANHNQVQKARGLNLKLAKTELIIRNIELSMTQKKQQKNNHKEVLSQQKNNHPELLSQLQPSLKLKASNLHAVCFTVGSWSWESKNPGDLVVKFYYGKKKLVWEFLFGSMKKKIEIRWTDISAINDYVDEKKNGRLQIELKVPPEYYQECKFKPQKHTQWERANDFTGGQASNCRRHTILFSPGVLDEDLKKLLRFDSRLYNLNRQPFPMHNSPFFDPSFISSYNISVSGCSSVPHSNHAQNLVQPTTSFAGSSGTNVVPIQGLMTFQNSYKSAMEVSYVNERANGVFEQSGLNQFQDIPLPPIRDQEPYERQQPFISDEQLELNHFAIQNLAEVTTKITNGVWEKSGNNHFQDIPLFPITEKDHNYEPYEGMQPFISDQQPELHHVANQNLADVTTEITNGVWEQCGNNQFQDISFLPSIRVQDDNELYVGLEPIIPDEQLGLHHHVANQKLAEVTTEQNCFKIDSSCKAFEQNPLNVFDPFVATTDGSCSNGGVMNPGMAFIDEDDDCSFAQLQFYDEFANQDPCFWSSSQYSKHGFNNGGNGGSST